MARDRETENPSFPSDEVTEERTGLRQRSTKFFCAWQNKRRSFHTIAMGRKREATDSISSDLPPADSVAEEIVVTEPVEAEASIENRRSTRLRLSAAPDIPNNSKHR